MHISVRLKKKSKRLKMVISGSRITEYFSFLHHISQLYFQCFYYKHELLLEFDALELDLDSLVTLPLTVWVTLEK